MKLHHFAAAIALLASPLAAHDYAAGTLSVDHPYGFTAPATAMASGGFMTITNSGDEDDRLIAIEAPFKEVQLHATIVDAAGVAKMVHQEDGIVIPAGETVTLEPGGYHVMFMGLDGDALEEDERVPATLVFEHAGRVEIEFVIRARGEMGHAQGMQGHGMEGQQMQGHDMQVPSMKRQHGTGHKSN